MKNILAIIPARGGSKRIPGKNLKELYGKPLIAHTIQEAKKSKYINKVVVSTEDIEIAQASKDYGAEIPILRPEELAKDDTPGIDPIIHMIKWLEENQNYKPDYVICLQCTSPFRKAQHIDDAIEALINSKSDSLVSVCESEVNPHWMKNVVNGKLEDFIKDSKFYARSQDLPKAYRLNGAIYIAKPQVIFKNKNWYTESTVPYIMDDISSIDIDKLLDFKFAEFLMTSNF